MTAYLYEHPNRHAPVRANGVRFHGHPTRTGGARPRVIVVHTTESAFDQIGEDTGAEGVARFQSTTDRPSSYHRIVDRDSTMLQLPDEATAFGAVGLNTVGLHVSLAMRAADWSDPAKAAAAEPALQRAAGIALKWSSAYGIPLRLITRQQALSGTAGVIGHGMADPGRRSDPGKDFPWQRFLALAADLDVQEDDMPLTREDARMLADAVWNDRRTHAGQPENVPGDVLFSTLAAVHALGRDEAAASERLAALIAADDVDPEALAAAIPDAWVERIADELAKRLQS